MHVSSFGIEAEIAIMLLYSQTAFGVSLARHDHQWCETLIHTLAVIVIRGSLFLVRGSFEIVICVAD